MYLHGPGAVELPQGSFGSKLQGAAHPLTSAIERNLRVVRAALRAREELVRLREAAIRLREEEVLHEDRAAAARAVFDALSAEIEASRLENARAALRARETPPPSLSPSESA